MRHLLPNLLKDVSVALSPTGGALAFVTLTNVKDVVAIISLIVGMSCTVLITHRKLKKWK